MNCTEFLEECHKRINNKMLDFVPVRKNRESRRKHGLTIYDIESVILSLESVIYLKNLNQIEI